MRVKTNNAKQLYLLFTSPALRQYWGTQAYTTYTNGRIYVNWALPTIVWNHHDSEGAEELLDVYRSVATWQAKLQNKEAAMGGRSTFSPTVYRNEREEAKTFQKIRYPVFPLVSDPHVQWTRSYGHGNDLNEWMVQGFSFNDDLASIRAYFRALTKLKESWQKMNK